MWPRFILLLLHLLLLVLDLPLCPIFFLNVLCLNSFIFFIEKFFDWFTYIFYLSSRPDILSSLSFSLMVRLISETLLCISKAFISMLRFGYRFYSFLKVYCHVLSCFHYFVKLIVFSQSSKDYLFISSLKSLNRDIIAIFKILSCASAKLLFFRVYYNRGAGFWRRCIILFDHTCDFALELRYLKWFLV